MFNTKTKIFLLSVAKDQQSGLVVGLLKGFLILLSCLYWFASRWYQWLYDLGILKCNKLDRPVISVGNITLGGVGKTPLVCLIAQIIQKYGYRPVILSRGYMEDAKDEESDEVKLLTENLLNVPVLVGPNRFLNAKKYLERASADIFILDDGFQHRSCYRDLDIVLIDSTDAWGNGWLLPRGILREPLNALRRAHLCVLTKTDLGKENLPAIYRQLKLISPHLSLCESVHRPVGMIDLISQKPIDILSIHNKKICSLCSIGDPASFEKTLLNLGAKLEKRISFLDHYVYNKHDIEAIQSRAREKNVDMIITTQKDAVKLKPFLSCFDQDMPLLCLRVDISFHLGEDKLFEGIHSLLQR